MTEAVTIAGDGGAPLRCTITSFGFKYGPHRDADWVVDVRFLLNPFWEAELRPLTGHDPPVVEYVMGQAAARELVDRLAPLLRWVLERSRERGRDGVTVGIGCTGGRHRSVVVGDALASRLRADGVEVAVRHRDVETPDPR